MPPYLTPGVYVEEVAGTPPIAGVGTSTAAFLGEVPDNKVVMPERPGSPKDGNKILYDLAPAGVPQRITNWGQFQTLFGGIQADNKVLAHAVLGFFLNGGTACHVVRVVSFTASGGAGEDGAGKAVTVDTALDALARIDEIALVVAPGAGVAVQKKVVEHCVNAGDRFAILDGKYDPQSTDVKQDTIVDGVGESPHAALYFPYLLVADPDGEDVDRRFQVPTTAVPPSGHVAGVYARVDAQRGVHKAPANEVVRGALGLTRQLTDGEQEGLNPGGVNVIRNFNGSILVWGARTLGGDANGEYKYVNVRRLMTFLSESLQEGTRFAVFEPNSAPLWQRIKRSVTAFLTLVWRDGALLGETPEQAFYVTCDESTNPPDVREAGRVVTEVGVAVVKPAEFVIFKISQTTGTAS